MSCHLDTVADELACPSKRRLPVADARVRDDVLAYLFLLNSFFLHYDGPTMSKAFLCIICPRPEIATGAVHEPPLLLYETAAAPLHQTTGCSPVPARAPARLAAGVVDLGTKDAAELEGWF